MKRIVFVLVSLLSLNFSYSKINVEWVSKYDGASNSLDIPGDFIIDDNSNVYITGTTFVDYTTGYDLILVKYDDFGVELWRTSYSHGNGDDEGVNITIINNTLYITCIYQDKLILMNYSLNGELLWEKLIVANNYNCNDVETISNNNFLFIKYNYIDYEGYYYSKLYKCDFSGNIIWNYDLLNTKIMTFSLNNEGDIILVGSNNYIITTPNAVLIGDAFIQQINDNGEVSWTSGINNGYFIVDMFVSIDVDENNNIFSILHPRTIIKYDNLGTLEWNSEFIHPNPDYDNTVINNVKYNNSKIYMSGISNIPNYADILTLCYNTNGDLEWYDNYFTKPAYYCYGTFLDIDNDDNVFSFGYRGLVNERDDIFIKAFSYDGTDLTEFNYNSTGIVNEPIEKVKLIGNSIYILAKSGADIMTIKLSNQYASSISNFETGKIDVYPNPFTNILNISLSNIFNNTTKKVITITDVLGKTIYSKKITNNTTTVVPNLSSGVYMLKISYNDNPIIIKKLIRIDE